VTLDARALFYKKIVAKCIPDKTASVLVVGGGIRDMEVFRELGFDNVVISNLDTRDTAERFVPYEWSYQDAERLTFDDNSFDYVVTHAALHHCHSPHKALLEMYRVSRFGALAFESRDSWLMKLFERTNMTQVFEPTAVRYNDGKFGGVANSEIPNFIYRWTEHEIEKTVNSYAPEYRHRIQYFYGNDTPATPLLERKGSIKRSLIGLLSPIYQLFVMIAPKQQNLFAFMVPKPSGPEQRQTWLKWEGDRPHFDMSWAEKVYK
jgi:SAM-dependent methyltransferase